MVRQIIALSGPVGAGKSTLARGLADRFGFVQVRTRELVLARIRNQDAGRRELQRAGTRLDKQTEGKWVADGLERLLRESPDDALVVVDAVRIQPQVEAPYRVYGSKVVHLHLTADEPELSRRYQTRSKASRGELVTYSDVRSDPTEAQVGDLKRHADVIIDSERSTTSDVLTRTAARLNLYGSGNSQLVDVIVGGQYGSEGKGNIAFYLAPDYDILMRVGGPNAGHSVMAWSGNPFIHHQLPSGTFNSQAKLLIGPGATLLLPKLLEEIAQCGVESDRLTIDEQAMVITKADIRREQSLVGRIGSTGQGGGAAQARRITDRGKVKLARDYPDLKPYMGYAAAVLENAYAQGLKVFLEGTQGTSLSTFHGPYPHVTSRDTTAAGCMAEAGIAPRRIRRVVLACRTYPIRVESPKNSTSGPMSQELSWETVEARAGFVKNELRENEKTSTTKRQRRVGEFDWAQLARSSLLNSPTDIALTFVDYLDSENQNARRFDQLQPETIRFIEEIETVAQAPVTLISTRFHSRSVIDRRSW